MTKDDFLQLQELQRNSGLALMNYLQEIGLSNQLITIGTVSFGQYGFFTLLLGYLGFYCLKFFDGKGG